MQLNLSQWPTPYLIVLSVAITLSMVSAGSFLTSMLSGWHTLARRYTAQSEPTGEVRTAGPFFYTVYWRFFCHYNNVVRATAAHDALYLSVMFLLRVGHPPLRIPWDEIQMRRTTFMWRRLVLLTLGNQEQIAMRISVRMARNLGILDRVPA